MKIIFRYWITTSAFWILLALTSGGKRWQFPAPFEVCWERQKALMTKTFGR